MPGVDSQLLLSSPTQDESTASVGILCIFQLLIWSNASRGGGNKKWSSSFGQCMPQDLSAVYSLIIQDLYTRERYSDIRQQELNPNRRSTKTPPRPDTPRQTGFTWVSGLLVGIELVSQEKLQLLRGSKADTTKLLIRTDSLCRNYAWVRWFLMLGWYIDFQREYPKRKIILKLGLLRAGAGPPERLSSEKRQIKAARRQTWTLSQLWMFWWLDSNKVAGIQSNRSVLKHKRIYKLKSKSEKFEVSINEVLLKHHDWYYTAHYTATFLIASSMVNI